MTNKHDRIYTDLQTNVKPFKFDKAVADVFQDMISRSVPGYQQILELLPTLVQHFKNVNGNYYDLGCSLGAGMAALALGMGDKKRRVIGIDNSNAMLSQADKHLAEAATDGGVNANCFTLQCEDIRHSPIDNAAMVIMNFTLQFVPQNDRDALIQRIYNGLNNDGVLVLSEKLTFSDSAIDQTLIDIHHQYKSDQGYSQLEIAQKRDAIEDVLIPESLATHQKRLSEAGFSIVTPWIQNLQFVSILAIKRPDA